MNPFRSDARWLAFCAWWMSARGDIAAWVFVAACGFLTFFYVAAVLYWLVWVARLILPAWLGGF